MAQIHTCDRCKQIIPNYQTKVNLVFLYNKHYIQDRTKPLFELEWKGNSHYCEMDLCEKCLTELSLVTNAFIPESK